MELRTEPFLGDEGAARDLVLALNVDRRHLSPAQRAVSVAALATYERGQRRQTGTRAGLTQPEAASLGGVSERAVRAARVVLRDAEPEMVEALVRGEVSLRAAESMTRAQRSAPFHAARRETQSDAWLTPPWVLDRASELLGGIDVDVASGPERNVPARRHLVLADGVDALAQASWRNPDDSPATAWMNCPFSGTGPGVWTRRMVAEYEAGHVSRAVLLLPARIGADWLRALGRFPRVELPRSAVRFAPGIGNPMHGQPVGPSPFAVILVGVGVEAAAMHQAFGDVGDVLVRYDSDDDGPAAPG
ncbi:hypothetical protein R8Z57_07475 [Microbacterium sp. M3]|uniref:Uncharacterized protein n=1 Tax=Microbacterium arthrosphaerae TaxID=792652 RepID=A0ABU4H1Q2_9MICO|nr:MULTISPECIES: hypothetical protein [Microbacterium]MDW4572615.1 hypothetical protein [Microbacterium arthrosphaerae]MDW7606470.1 hypothetical protein [Microbacterium sp. M3]